MKVLIRDDEPWYRVTNCANWDNEFSEWVVAVIEITGQLFKEIINCSCERRVEIIKEALT